MPRLSCNEAKQLLELIRADFGVLKGELDYYAATGDQDALKNVEMQKGLLERQTKELKRGLPVTPEYAAEILGKEFLGPEAIKKAFSFELLAELIPPIPFTIEDLERAKELNQFLILRIPLTMQKMGEILSDQKVFSDTSWYQNEAFYTTELSKPGWALVSKEPIPNSTNQNYIEQTQTICDYLDSEVFGNVDEMPELYQAAIMEFEAKKQHLEELMGTDWQACVKELSELQITKLTRQSPADVVHDLFVYKQNNEQRLLENVYTWASARSSVGNLVGVGLFWSDGLRVGSEDPDRSGDDLGVSFSRSQ